MDTYIIEKRRRALSTHYNEVARYRIRTLGHHQSPFPRRSTLGAVAATIRNQFLAHYWANPPQWRMLIRQHLTGQRTLPDFCVIGAPKCATTDVAISVMLHPYVIAPLAKEFWLPDPEYWRIFYPTESEKRRHVARYGGAMSLYCTPALHVTEAICRLSKLKADMKVALILRDPVKRCFSQWKWEVFLTGPRRVSQHPFLSTFRSYVDHALETFPDAHMDTMVGYPVLQTSIYWRKVAYWIKYFGRSNVMPMNVDEYFLDRSTFTKRIQTFVGLPTMAIPTFQQTINENPLDLPQPDSESVEKLTQFFLPYNQRLWDIIGEKYTW